MIIQKDFPLKDYNTFAVKVTADYFVELGDEEGLKNFIRRELGSFDKVLILGGGSNVLFLEDFHGLVIAVRNKGIHVRAGAGDKVLVTAQAGENWEKLVDYCTDAGFGGLQNMAMIPGNVGSAPIQNIGAYGSELKDVFSSLEGFMLEKGEKFSLSKEECAFGYRDSIFKKELKGKAIITSVTLELRKNSTPDISYKALSGELKKLKINEPSIAEVRDTIKKIRTEKLPNPELMGNAGSFFKNPLVTAAQYKCIVDQHPDLTAYPQQGGDYKLAAGWLIEKCGWKGFRTGDAGVHERQALVLVNYGKATGRDIHNLALEISQSVEEKFGVKLEMEVNLIG